MVFMEDSERASNIARERGIDAGLHLNLTTPFSSAACSARVREHQHKIASYLRGYHPLSTIVFHPGLAGSFDYVVKTQREEFQRLYRHEPTRIDGHHHMHLCSNVLWTGLLPAGIVVRRNFSFAPGEKGFCNRFYRRAIDRVLARKHQLTDFFFSIEPLEQPNRLQKIASLAQRFVVEVETHPAHPKEYELLTNGAISSLLAGCPIAAGFATN
jgi:predicted glycoside hydrolase/deacetylase ChbG (UPF0249 family)